MTESALDGATDKARSAFEQVCNALKNSIPSETFELLKWNTEDDPYRSLPDEDFWKAGDAIKKAEAAGKERQKEALALCPTRP